MQIYQKNNSLVLLQRDAKGSFKNASLFKESELSPQEYGIRERQWSGVSEGPAEAVKNIASFNDR